MGEVLLGVVALVLIVFLLRAFVGADPKALLKALRYVGAGALVLATIGFFAIDRPGVGAFLGSIAWGMFTGGRVWPGGWPHYKWPWPTAGSASDRQTSSVRTSWLEMELDHASGEMHGTILKGKHAGQRLDRLDRDALIALYDESGADDPESQRLLEAYLDRTLGAGWRPEPKPGADAPPDRSGGAMTRSEALEILGLDEGASDEDIRATHRRLMMQNHPDRGGSDYLASKINEAKDFLVGH